MRAIIHTKESRDLLWMDIGFFVCRVIVWHLQKVFILDPCPSCLSEVLTVAGILVGSCIDCGPDVRICSGSLIEGRCGSQKPQVGPSWREGCTAVVTAQSTAALRLP